MDVFKELPTVIHIPIKANMTELNRIKNEAVSMTKNSKEIGRGLDMVQFRKCMEQYRQEAIKLKLPNVIAVDFPGEQQSKADGGCRSSG